jgi:hypothetical protein
MSYCTIEEAFQSNIADTALPLSKHHIGEQSKLEKAKLKSRKHSSKRVPQEPNVIEPDRPAHRHKSPAEILSGTPDKNEASSSISSYLIGASDPNEDYFPYPTGAGGEGEFDKQFLLEPNWYEQLHDRVPRSENIQVPGWPVDGKSTLYTDIQPDYRRANDMNNHTDKENKKAVSVPAAMTHDSEMRRRIDEIYQKMDQLEISRSESNHSEIILFVMTGIFVLLLLDLLLKQGSRLLGTIATASAIPQVTMRGGGAINNPFMF